MINYDAYKAACAEEDAALDEYFRLRDAKSDGCCHGMTIPQVLAYDSQIEAAAQRLANARGQGSNDS
jgi:hypothetical protein